MTITVRRWTEAERKRHLRQRKEARAHLGLVELARQDQKRQRRQRRAK